MKNLFKGLFLFILMVCILILIIWSHIQTPTSVNKVSRFENYVYNIMGVHKQNSKYKEIYLYINKYQNLSLEEKKYFLNYFYKVYHDSLNQIADVHIFDKNVLKPYEILPCEYLRISKINDKACFDYSNINEHYCE